MDLLFQLLSLASASVVEARDAGDGSSRGSVLWRLRGSVAPAPVVFDNGPLFVDGPMMSGPA
jgi:hypothetical protein